VYVMWAGCHKLICITSAPRMTHLKLVNITVLWHLASCAVVDLYHPSKGVEILTQGCTNTSL